MGYRRDNGAHGIARFLYLTGTNLYPVHRLADQGFNFLGRLRAALRQITHFTGNHRKPTPLFTGPGSLYRCVQRQNVGLEGDTVDHAGNICNFAGAIRNALHGLHHTRRNFAPFLGHLLRFFRQFPRLMHVIRVVFHRRGQLFHTGGGFLQRRGLLIGTARQLVITLPEFAGAVVDIR